MNQPDENCGLSIDKQIMDERGKLLNVWSAINLMRCLADKSDARIDAIDFSCGMSPLLDQLDAACSRLEEIALFVEGGPALTIRPIGAEEHCHDFTGPSMDVVPRASR